MPATKLHADALENRFRRLGSTCAVNRGQTLFYGNKWSDPGFCRRYFGGIVTGDCVKGDGYNAVFLLSEAFMPQVLIFVAFLVLAMVAPLKVTVLTCAALLVVTLITQKTTELVTGAPATTGDAFQSVCLAFVFQLVIAFTLMSYNKHFQGVSSIPLAVGFPIAYVAAFQLGMEISTWQACIVAVVTTLVSWALFFGAYPMLLAI